MAKGLFGMGRDTEAQADGAVAAVETSTAVDGESKLKEQKRAAFLKMQAKKKAALEKLVSLAERIGDEEEKAAAVYLTPGHRAAGPKSPSVKKNLIAEIFPIGTDVVHEDKIFLDHKLGRPDMAKLIKQAVNQTQPIWIKFDVGTGNYEVASRDAMPEGWLGPMPKADKVL